MTRKVLPEPGLVTSRYAAAALGVSVRTVQLWCNNGTLRTLRTPGNHRRIRLSDLQVFQDTMSAAKDTIPLMLKGAVVAIVHEAVRTLQYTVTLTPEGMLEHALRCVENPRGVTYMEFDRTATTMVVLACIKDDLSLRYSIHYPIACNCKEGTYALDPSLIYVLVSSKPDARSQGTGPDLGDRSSQARCDVPQQR